MINPTLFIGLGSTGLNILEKLQEHVLEHYGSASLDIFKYIAIESREGAEIKHSEWGDNEITLLKPVIRGTDAIRNEVKSGHKGYLKDWLNLELLNISGGQFTDGASNIRMAGRLILWENWDTLSEAVNNAYNNITSNLSRTKTERFLRDHYARHRQPIDDRRPLIGNLPNVYIVGTLCGGTCSGMFIDIGYYVKQITGLWAQTLQNPNLAKVIGVFSNFDAATLNKAKQEGVRGHAANSWAALMEYDFFCHPQTRYKTTFPDGTEIDTNERPIDWLYMISCTATDSSNQRKSNFRIDENPDIGSLNHMAATILFTETVGALVEKKEEIRTDYRARPRATATNENEHSPCIATCGIATIWYPKYRIALGAACKYGASICEEWLGQLNPETKQIIDKDFPDKWHNMLSQRIDELTKSLTGDILSDVAQEFDKSVDEFVALSSSKFKNSLQEKISLLNKGEKYDVHINDHGRTGPLKDVLLKDINDFVKTIINTKSNLAFARYSLELLDGSIAGTIERLPSQYPSSDLGKVRQTGSDVFGKLVFKAKAIEKESKHNILKEVKEYIISHIKHIRNFRMRAVLENIRGEIGIVENLSEDEVKAGKRTLKQYLDNVEKSLHTCMNGLQARYEELCKDINKTQDVKIVSYGVPNVIKDDIDQLMAQLKNISPAQKKVILDNLKDEKTLSEFIGFGDIEEKSEIIKKSILEKLIHEVLKKSGKFDVVDHVLQNWTASEISEFAKHGLPHMELNPGHSGLASVTIGRPVSFTTGGNQAYLETLLDDKLKGTECEGIYGRNDKSPLYLPELSHMLIFYSEEPLMYMDDNFATAALFEGCYKSEEGASKYGLHIHKGGKNVFDPQVYSRRDKTNKELLPIAINIFSMRGDDGQWVSSEIFEIEKKQLILRGKRKNGLKFRLTADASGVEICSQEKELFEYFNALIADNLKNMQKDSFIKRLNIYIDWIEKESESKGEDPSPVMEKERKQIMEIGLIKEHFPKLVEG